jgi:ribonucleoside-triphosphate reductase
MSKICGKSCEVYSRIVGYYRPTANWNRGKKEEFKERITFAVPSTSHLEHKAH